MAALFFARALLPTGWADAVRITVADDGSISGVETGADPGDADHVDGVGVPGVPNLHSHAFQRALAGLTERGSERGDSFWGWRERMYAFLERLEPDDVQAVAAQLQVELLRNGYTHVAEFHYLRNAPDGQPYADPVEMARRILAAADETGIGLTVLPVLYRTSDFGGKAPTHGQVRFVATVDALLSDIAVLRRSTNGLGGRRVGLALHSLRAVPPDQLELAVTAFNAMDAAGPIHIHIAEQRKEVEACVAWSGKRPVQWLLENADVDRRWCAVHATHMTVDETMALANTGAVVGLCPTTEANLGDGVFPFPDYAAVNGVWGVGTDSHVSVSPVADLRMLEYGQRLAGRERNVAAGYEDRSTGLALLEGAWTGGAQACGVPVGRIAEGHRADIVALDPDHPALAGRADEEILDSWIFSGEETPVRHVVVGGRRVVTDGRHERQEEIADAYREVARRLNG